MKYILVLLLLALLLFACRSLVKQKQVYKVPTTPPIISIAKTKCFGKCPIFQCAFYTDGTVIYNGEKNVSNIGKYHGKITNQTFIDLQNQFEAGDFPGLKSEYLLNLPDKAKTIIAYQGKKVTLHTRNASPELRKLIKQTLSVIEKIEFEAIQQ